MSLAYCLYRGLPISPNSSFAMISKADHGVQRRAQFVTHIGQEGRFRRGCFFGLLTLFVRFLGQRLDPVFLRFGAAQRVGEAALVLRQFFFLALSAA